ncbi:MAG: hypothetical protein V4489_02910 [Chlamydiota bacterium]
MSGIEKISSSIGLRFDNEIFMQGTRALLDKVKQIALVVIAGISVLVSPVLNEFMKLNPKTYTAIPGGFSITLNEPQMIIIGVLVSSLVLSSIYFSNRNRNI